MLRVPSSTGGGLCILMADEMLQVNLAVLQPDNVSTSGKQKVAGQVRSAPATPPFRPRAAPEALQRAARAARESKETTPLSSLELSLDLGQARPTTRCSLAKICRTTSCEQSAKTLQSCTLLVNLCIYVRTHSDV